MNTDGAVFSKQRWTGIGIGVIARDDQGRVVAAMSKTLQVPLGALEIEAKAVEAAAIFPRDIGIQEVIFESDSLLVCLAIQGKTEASPPIANVISGTLPHMQFFCQVEVCHTRREGHKEAHGLTKYAQFIDNFVTWMEETPTVIDSEVSSDVNQYFQS